MIVAMIMIHTFRQPWVQISAPQSGVVPHCTRTSRQYADPAGQTIVQSAWIVCSHFHQIDMRWSPFTCKGHPRPFITLPSTPRLRLWSIRSSDTRTTQTSILQVDNIVLTVTARGEALVSHTCEFWCTSVACVGKHNCRCTGGFIAGSSVARGHIPAGLAGLAHFTMPPTPKFSMEAWLGGLVPAELAASLLDQGVSTLCAHSFPVD